MSKPKIAISLESDILKEIDQKAKDENRSRSNVIETLLLEALKQRK